MQVRSAGGVSEKADKVITWALGIFWCRCACGCRRRHPAPVVLCHWRVMLLLLRDYATFDYAKFAILERDYATHYASII